MSIAITLFSAILASWMPILGGAFVPLVSVAPKSPNQWATSTFVPTAVLRALPTPDESAQALTEYMAKAQEELQDAVAGVEARYMIQVEVRPLLGHCSLISCKTTKTFTKFGRTTGLTV